MPETIDSKLQNQEEEALYKQKRYREVQKGRDGVEPDTETIHSFFPLLFMP